MSTRRHAVTLLFVLMLSLLLTGCHLSATSQSASRVHIVSGKVVSKPPPAGQVGIEQWRFQPNVCPEKFMRLTHLEWEGTDRPEDNEIDLNPYAGKLLKVKYNMVVGEWLWGAVIKD